MTNPFPPIQQGGTIMDPGTGGALASALAQVLAGQQQQREQAFRQAQLQNQIAQQQALAQYYQGQVSLQSREQGRLEAEAASNRSQAAQVGGAIRNALSPAAPQAPSVATAIPGQPTMGAPVAPGAVPGQPAGAGNAFADVLSGGAAFGGQAGLSSILSGVAPENVPAAIQGLQEVAALQPKPPELPTSAKEFEYLKRLASRDPQAALLYKQLFLDKQPSTVINNIPAQGATEFSKALGKAQVELLTKGVEEAKTASQSFPALVEAYKLVDKSFTGFGANQLLGLARAMNATGFKVTGNRAADSQTFLKLTRDQTLAYLQTRALGSGTAVSDRDREFMERQSAADLTLEPDAIKRILRINVGVGLNKILDAMNDLRDQAIAYPENAEQLNQQANNLAKRAAPIWAQYGKMLKDEADREKATQRRAGPIGDQLFPQR